MSPLTSARLALLATALAPCDALAAAPGPAPAAATVPVAITVDDLPFVGPTARGDGRLAAVRRLARAFVDSKTPMTGFVVCKAAKAAPKQLDAYVEAKIPLANHSTTHAALDDTTVEAWLADVDACQRQLTKRLGAPPRYFRYPYLRTGKTRASRDAAAAGLNELGLVRAPVSVDTSEWLLPKPYVDALDAKDEARAEAIAQAYVDHIVLALNHYRAVARARYGRELPQVVLLHANAVLADHAPRLLKALEAAGARFVTLSEALADPVYARPDDWVDPVGASWLYRTAPATKKAWAWDKGQQRALQARFSGRAESAPTRIGRATSVRRLAGQPAWVVVHHEPVAANALVYRTAEGTPVLVDTPWTSEATDAVLDWAHLRFGRPVGLAIVGHFHADSAGGVAALRARGVRTLGSAHTAKLIETRGASLQRTLIESYGPAFAGPPPTPPEERFDPAEGHAETVGGTQIRVLFPGPAHAPDNVVTFFPETGLLFGGCMVKTGGLGYLGDADVPRWPAAIRRLQALEPKVVIPGHGDETTPALLGRTLGALKKHAAKP